MKNLTQKLLESLTEDQITRFIGLMETMQAGKRGEKTEADIMQELKSLSEEEIVLFRDIMSSFLQGK